MVGGETSIMPLQSSSGDVVASAYHALSRCERCSQNKRLYHMQASSYIQLKLVRFADSLNNLPLTLYVPCIRVADSDRARRCHIFSTPEVVSTPLICAHVRFQVTSVTPGTSRIEMGTQWVLEGAKAVEFVHRSRLQPYT